MANALVVGGFALPGLVIALALVRWVLDVPLLGGLYQTLAVLIVAYVIHFGSQAMRAAQVATGAVPARLDDAARMLGRRPVAPAADGRAAADAARAAGRGRAGAAVDDEGAAGHAAAAPDVDRHPRRAHLVGAEAARWADTGLASIVLVALSAVLTWWLVTRRVERLA